MATQQGMRDALTYTPGDGYVYRWDGGPWITVHKIQYNVNDQRTEELTADVITAPAIRTGTALVAAVDTWRTARLPTP